MSNKIVFITCVPHIDEQAFTPPEGAKEVIEVPGIHLEDLVYTDKRRALFKHVKGRGISEVDFLNALPNKDALLALIEELCFMGSDSLVCFKTGDVVVAANHDEYQLVMVEANAIPDLIPLTKVFSSTTPRGDLMTLHIGLKEVQDWTLVKRRAKNRVAFLHTLQRSPLVNTNKAEDIRKAFTAWRRAQVENGNLSKTEAENLWIYGADLEDSEVLHRQMLVTAHLVLGAKAGYPDMNEGVEDVWAMLAARSSGLIELVLRGYGKDMKDSSDWMAVVAKLGLLMAQGGMTRDWLTSSLVHDNAIHHLQEKANGPKSAQ